MHSPNRVSRFAFHPETMNDERKKKKAPSAKRDEKDENHIKSLKDDLKHRSNALIKIIKYFKNANNDSF